MTDSQPAKRQRIVVKRSIYEQFLSGNKRFEYRRHRAPFTDRAFYLGREVRLAYCDDIGRYPSRIGRVVSFCVRPAAECPDLSTYPALNPADEIAVIELDLVDSYSKRAIGRSGALLANPAVRGAKTASRRE